MAAQIKTLVCPQCGSGRCTKVAGTNTEMSLPLASIFKLYVLYALSDAVKAGAVGYSADYVVLAVPLRALSKALRAGMLVVLKR